MSYLKLRDKNVAIKQYEKLKKLNKQLADELRAEIDSTSETT